MEPPGRLYSANLPRLYSRDIGERRSGERQRVQLKTFVRKVLPDGKTWLGEFRSLDLSDGGVFVSTEDLSIFDLGEELEIMVDDGQAEYFRGSARVVRSARLYQEESSLSESGFGLMFLAQEANLTKLIDERLGSS